MDWCAQGVLVVSTCLVGCGRVGFDPLAGPAAASCDWSSAPQLTAPRLLAVGSNLGHLPREPFITPDGETFFYATSSSEPGIYRAQRIGDVFGPAQMAMEIQSASPGKGYSQTADGLVGSLDLGTAGVDADILLATRASTQEPFPVFSPIDSVNSPGDDYDSQISANGLALWFASRSRPDCPEGKCIYSSVRTSRSLPFEAPTRVELATGAMLPADPTVTADGLTIVYSATLDKPNDLYYATRATTSEPFGQPIPLADANSAEYEGHAHIRADGCELFFLSDRNGVVYQLFVSSFVRNDQD